ncbi:MAG TPA: 2'-5' RNA ligase family protein [Chryseosolibacter sp.]
MAAAKDDKSQLYFIAFIPPAPVFEDALKLKQYFKETYQSKAALNSPPHITLHMPFRWRSDKEGELIDKLKTFVKRHDPLKLCIDNFSSFPPRVIFLNVVTSEPLVTFQKNLQRFCKRELNLFNANYKEDAYHPHLTLAFRDLKKSVYPRAWEEFSKQEYKAEFIADKVALLKHDGRGWAVLKEFTLESSYSTENEQELATTEG